MKKRIFSTLMVSFALVFTGCARNPVTGKRQIVLVSESQEIAIGQQSDPQVREQYGVVENVALQAYVQSLGRKLVAVSHRPNLEWHFTVVDSSVVNAFAIPGGFVYLTRGILVYLRCRTGDAVQRWAVQERSAIGFLQFHFKTARLRFTFRQKIIVIHIAAKIIS